MRKFFLILSSVIATPSKARGKQSRIIFWIAASPRVAGLLAMTFIFVAPAFAQRPIIIGYQGVIEAKGDILDNTTVYMKFVLCNKDCATVYWSHDASSVEGEEPASEVAVKVAGGVFNVLLGDTTITNMDTIPASIFDTIGDNDLYLRVWLDDGIFGFEQLAPDQLISIVPFAARAISAGETFGNMTLSGDMSVTTTATGDEDGVVFDAQSVTEGTGVLIKVGDGLDDSGFAFKIEDPSQTLFSVDENGSAFSRDFLLAPLTSASDTSRFVTGRIFYDGTANVFKACDNQSCSQISIAGTSGVADITAVTAGNGLTGGGTSGAVTLSVDTTAVVTKTGDHIMTGNLTVPTLTGTTVTGTTVNATNVVATGDVASATLTLSDTATTENIVMTPTGTATGNTAELRFRELAANSTQYVGFKAQDSIIATQIWALPDTAGNVNQVLAIESTGILYWKNDSDAGGDIQSVNAGLGIGGGGSSGSVTLFLSAGTGITPATDGVEFDYTTYVLGQDSVLQAANETVFTDDAQGGVLFEGTTDNANQTLLTVVDPTAANTITLPNATGTVALTSSNVASATALATDPTDCGADTYATAIATSGNLTCGAVSDAGVTDALTISGGTVNNSVIGAVTAAAGTFTTVTATTSVASSGNITSSATGTIGWSVQAAANQACSTTCTNACVFGQDGATKDIVDCANATADVCVCAGVN